MRLLQKLEARLRQAEVVEQLSEQIAEASFERAWQRVQHRIFAFAPAEARGYVRARARCVVEPAVGELSQQLSHSARTRLYALCMDQLVRRITDHVHVSWSRDRRQRAA